VLDRFDARALDVFSDQRDRSEATLSEGRSIEGRVDDNHPPVCSDIRRSVATDASNCHRKSHRGKKC